MYFLPFFAHCLEREINNLKCTNIRANTKECYLASISQKKRDKFSNKEKKNIFLQNSSIPQKKYHVMIF